VTLTEILEVVGLDERLEPEQDDALYDELTESLADHLDNLDVERDLLQQLLLVQQLQVLLPKKSNVVLAHTILLQQMMLVTRYCI
jgi:hypothetical protein